VAVTVQGTVQGIGFRPFLYREAARGGLTGWVRNRTDGVELEVQGTPGAVEAFLDALHTRPPPAARITTFAVSHREPVAESHFVIAGSDAAGPARPSLPADLAPCPACRRELGDPADRRHGYPFTNCTYCGPRYSIVEGLPYDRPRTVMRAFPLCPACLAEYESPGDRRFHAQPVACPACGPALRYLDPHGRPLAAAAAALTRAVATVRDGGIVALKGVGGYQLLCDATSAEAVVRLRDRKQREAKPFAVMFPHPEPLAADAERGARAALDGYVSLGEAERALLTSPAAPIVLARKRTGPGARALAAHVAENNPYLGVMLPASPLHLLFMEALGGPAVCTSGNLAGEPLCTDDAEALARLAGIADGYLVHDRPIVRPVDDSVTRAVTGGPLLLRRARGYAPRPLELAEPVDGILAVGAQLKNTVALGIGHEAVMSQHLGDLDSVAAAELLAATVDDLLGFFNVAPRAVACDLHPDYVSTRYAEQLAKRLAVPLLRVQHHHAHAAAVMAEHGLAAALALAWDGTGHGDDGLPWGGEVLRCEGMQATRVAHLRPFPLPGGDAAARDPRRSALGLLFAHDPSLAARYAAAWYPRADAEALLALLASGKYAPRTTSVGRLFDAVAALLGLAAENRFEGEAAMALEFAAVDAGAVPAYALPLDGGANGCGRLDWGPLLGELLGDLAAHVSPARISARFHAALGAGALAAAQASGAGAVALAGGCFQNARLVEELTARFAQNGITVYRAVEVPPNDGGIALGQLLVAARRLAAGEGGTLRPIDELRAPGERHA
jgi:hydrogenase maturation protein HypF